jgi:UDP-glucose 4-epimerase
MSSSKVVLVTGGAGFIGSHTLVELLESGYEAVVVDNLINASEESLKRVEEITGKKILAFYKVDIGDEEGLEKVFNAHPNISSVIHFAGLKAVGESVAQPIRYFKNNVNGSLVLFSVMQKHSVRNIVFSSSATVYGDVKTVPEQGLYEEMETSPPTNPYGRTKFFIEEILKDLNKSEKGWNIVILRYFNPVGAHPSGKIGEDPRGIPNNLMPYITQTAVGKREFLSVYGNDYPTKDGTGVRDYIHVVDLAKGHIAAVNILVKNPGYVVYNLGTGKGYSVLDMLNAMKKASGREIPYKFVDRRPGDIAICFASPAKAAKELGWTAKLNVDDMCRDAWKWQVNNPEGYSNL